jgi:2-methylcitrate dehydratase PrpD
MALLRGSVAAPDFTDALVEDRELLDFSRRVSVHADTVTARNRLSSAATVQTSDGRRLTFDRDSSRPLWIDDPGDQWERLRAKFEALVDPVLGGRTAELVDEVRNLASSPDIRSLVQALAA